LIHQIISHWYLIHLTLKLIHGVDNGLVSIKKLQLQKINPENPALAHYVSVDVITIQEFLSCAGVCQIGRLGVWSSVIALNIIYLTSHKLKENPKSLNAMKITGWVIIGMNMGLSLILNWPLFIRSIPAYVILILLQLDLYADEPNATPSTSTKQLV
jgi:hypothetical protein